MAHKKNYHALGIMNGTSIDAVDYCLISSDPNLKSLKFKKHKQYPIPTKLKKKLLAAASNQLTTYDLSLLHYELGELYGKHVAQLKKAWKWDVIGVHGQTIYHQGRKATCQSCHPFFIAYQTEKPVLYDFRGNDIALGGEGAPFAPFFQKVLAHNLKIKNWIFHNLGRI